MANLVEVEIADNPFLEWIRGLSKTIKGKNFKPSYRIGGLKPENEINNDDENSIESNESLNNENSENSEDSLNIESNDYYSILNSLSKKGNLGRLVIPISKSLLNIEFNANFLKTHSLILNEDSLIDNTNINSDLSAVFPAVKFDLNNFSFESLNGSTGEIEENDGIKSIKILNNSEYKGSDSISKEEDSWLNSNEENSEILVLREFQVSGIFPNFPAKSVIVYLISQPLSWKGYSWPKKSIENNQTKIQNSNSNSNSTAPNTPKSDIDVNRQKGKNNLIRGRTFSRLFSSSSSTVDYKSKSNNKPKPITSTLSIGVDQLRAPQTNVSTTNGELTFKEFLSRMKTAKTQEINRGIRKFIETFRDVTPGFTDQGRILRNFLDDAMRRLSVNPVWINSSEIELESVSEYLEKYILTKLYNRTFAPNVPKSLLKVVGRSGTELSSASSFQDLLDRDAKLNIRLKALSFLTFKELDIDNKYYNEIAFNLAKEQLNKIDEFKSPRDKLVCILNCCKIIYNVINNVTPGAGADEFLPILIYVVLITNPKNIASNSDYIERFRDPTKLISEQAYYFMQYTTAIMFLETVNASKLSDISEEEFHRKLEQSHHASVDALPPVHTPLGGTEDLLNLSPRSSGSLIVNKNIDLISNSTGDSEIKSFKSSSTGGSKRSDPLAPERKSRPTLKKSGSNISLSAATGTHQRGIFSLRTSKESSTFNNNTSGSRLSIELAKEAENLLKNLKFKGKNSIDISTDDISSLYEEYNEAIKILEKIMNKM